jgi:hypothetical protein
MCMLDEQLQQRLWVSRGLQTCLLIAEDAACAALCGTSQSSRVVQQQV